MGDFSLLLKAWDLIYSDDTIIDMFDLHEHLGINDNLKDKNTVMFFMFYNQLSLMLSDARK